MVSISECHIKGVIYYPGLVPGTPILLQTEGDVKLAAHARLDTVLARQYHRITGHALVTAVLPPKNGCAATTSLGISPVVGRLTLDQEAEVRTLHPQPFHNTAPLSQPYRLRRH